MSLPKFLSLSGGEALEPLLPAKARPEREMSRTSDGEFSSVPQPVLHTHSFASEPFHRFRSPGQQPLERMAEEGQWRNGPGDGSGERFTGGIDANSDPEVAAFAQNERVRGVGNRASAQLVDSTFSAAVNTDPGNRVYYKNDESRTKFEEATLYVREGELNDKFFNHPTGRWSKLAYKILHHPLFHVFDLLLTILLMLLALIEKPSVLGERSGEQPLVSVHGVLELLILGLLGVDIVLRLIWLSPRHFVRHRRTMFITVMLCVMVIEALVVLIRQQSHLRITRALRPIFFIDTYLMLGVRRVLRQIFQSLKVIVDVILLLFFVVAFFALIAYYLYAEADPTYFDTFGLSFVSLFITTTTANNPDVMMEAYGQYDASPIFFLIYLVITLYFVTNILLAVVISNFSEEEKEKFRKLFLHKREALRHAFRVLRGPTGIIFDDFLTFMQHYTPRMPEWQVMCVFKALHADPSNQHSELSEAEFSDFYEVQNLKWREVTEEGEDVLWFENFQPLVKRVFMVIHSIVKWEWFNSIIYIVIIVNMVFLVLYTAFITEPEAHNRFKHINVVLPVSFLFLLVYMVEITLKILALGPVEYFKKFWNMCDFVVIVVSLVAVCLEFHPLYHSLAVVRPIKLIRIIRLKKRYRDIMNTMVVLTPRLISVSLLLMVIYYFFAILGMEAFQYTVHEDCCVNASYSVGPYYAGSLNGSSPDPAIYYLNNFDNLLRSFVTLFILMVVNNWFIIMEGFASEVSHHWAARIYFFSFYIVTLVVLQVVISFIVEAFVLQLEQAYHREQKKKLLGRDFTLSDDADCVEDEQRKKEVRIALLHEDIKKLNYNITFNDELCTRHKEPPSLDRMVKKLRRINLPQNGMQCSGRRLRTKDDLHLLKYRADIEQWIQEQDAAFRQVEDASPHPNPPVKQKLWTAAKKVLVYLLE